MDEESIKLIVDELATLLTGRAPGKIFQLGPTSLAIDFRLPEAGYLLISVDPSAPRLYLIKRRVRELEKQSNPLTSFALGLRKELANTRVAAVEKQESDRIVWFELAGEDDLGKPKERKLLAQLTGRSANLLLLDDRNTIIHTLRSSPSGGMNVGDVYEKSGARQPTTVRNQTDLVSLIRRGDSSPSETADRYFTSVLAEKAKASRIASARAELRRKVSQQERLLRQLQRDFDEHKNSDQHKRIGDLLLANLSTAKRDGSHVTLIDYFADDAPTLEVEIDASASLPEEATRRFGLYARSKRAIEQIDKRMQAVRSRLRELDAEHQSLESRIAAGQFPALVTESTAAPGSETRREKERKRVPGTRQYLSVDGFEILVGRTANDNDQLTFKIAKPNDLWLHAADYGGSHVVVRNSTRKEIPHRTLIEAAQLAAHFSQAKKSPKADVHYTERKFVSKIKGAKPGLVRLQRFKNITVEPKEAGTRA